MSLWPVEDLRRWRAHERQILESLAPEEAEDERFVQPGGGGGAAARLVAAAFVNYADEGKKLSVSIDGGAPITVAVIAYGGSAEEFSNFDLSGGKAMPPMFSGVTVYLQPVAAGYVCVVPYFAKGCNAP